jgi:hypothetical protein
VAGDRLGDDAGCLEYFHELHVHLRLVNEYADQVYAYAVRLEHDRDERLKRVPSPDISRPSGRIAEVVIYSRSRRAVSIISYAA